MSKPFDLERAIRVANRADNLREAEQNGAWVIRKRKMLRIPSKNELCKRISGTLTCFHDLPYTIPCTKCRRTRADAQRERDRIVKILADA